MTTDIGMLVERLDRLEAETAVRNVMARYMRLCERLDADLDMDQVGFLFCEQAVWEGRGAHYAAEFGRHTGRAAIVAMLDAYRQPQPHFKFNAHYLASEDIVADIETATGRWMMLQASTYSDGQSELRSADLHVDFAQEAGAWRIAHFRTTNLFKRSITRWRDADDVEL